MKKRKFEELFFRVLMILATVIVSGSFFLIVGTVFIKGIPYMNWDMITKTPGGGFYIGKEGGILNAIIGSFYVAGGATILGLIISIPVAIFINLYMDGKRFLSNTIRATRQGRSTPSFSEHRSADNSSGSIGTTRSGK